MNKNLNNVVEQTEKELECVCGGMPEPTESIKQRAGQIKSLYKALRGKGLSHEQALKELERIKKGCDL